MSRVNVYLQVKEANQDMATQARLDIPDRRENKATWASLVKMVFKECLDFLELLATQAIPVPQAKMDRQVHPVIQERKD